MNFDIQNLISVGIGLVFIPVSVSYRKKINRLQSTGIEVTGIVFDIVYRSNMPGNIRSNRYPIIRFLTVENKWMTEEYKNSIGLFKKGKKVTVVYNPEDPKDFIVNNQALKYIPTVFLIFGVMAICYGLLNLLK